MINAGLMRSRITIQQSTVTTDSTGNHVKSWQSYRTVWAYANMKSGKEYAAAGQTVDSDSIVFAIRYIGALDSGNYRILFGGDIYNIVSVDDYQFRHETLKVTAERVRR